MAAHAELAVADSDNLASACMFMRDLASCGRTMPRVVCSSGRLVIKGTWVVPLDATACCIVMDTGQVGQRAGPGGVLWAEGPSAFAFLVRDWGFLGPERIDGGLAYHRSGLHVRIEFWTWNHEAGFSTTVERVDDLSAQVQVASLGRLYVACGLGPAQDVLETAGSGHALRKRITQHSTALQLVLPRLSGPPAASLFARCSGREPAGS